MQPSELPDHYEVLQVSHGARPLIINKAYRLLAAIYHPDKKQTGDPEAFHRVLEAHHVLSDPMLSARHGPCPAESCPHRRMSRPRSIMRR